MSARVCSVPDCDGRHVAKGLCGKHYQRVAKFGTPNDPRPSKEDRYWDKVVKTPLCWLWTGAKAGSGYGNFWDGERYRVAHHISFIEANGPIPDGREIDHLCRVRRCVNPAHLEAVTPKVNQNRGMAPGGIVYQTGCCLQGHPFTSENTYRRPDGKGRQCRACTRERQCAARERRKARAA